MAKVTIIAQTLYIFADFSKEDIERVRKFRPEALDLIKDNGDVVFRVVSTATTPSVSAYGIAFNAEENGKAYVEITIPNVEDKKQWAAENFAGIVDSLKKIEAKVETAKAEIADFQNQFIGDITDVTPE